MAIAGILKHINSFIQPGFILDMMVKTIVLYVISGYMSSAIEKLFQNLPFFDKDIPDASNTTTDKIKRWVQVLVQVAVCAPVAFLLRAVVEYLGNKYDFLDEVMSPKSAAGASLIAGMAFFMNQETLKGRMKRANADLGLNVKVPDEW
jgi:hypothetical protein